MPTDPIDLRTARLDRCRRRRSAEFSTRRARRRRRPGPRHAFIRPSTAPATWPRSTRSAELAAAAAAGRVGRERQDLFDVAGPPTTAASRVLRDKCRRRTIALSVGC